MTQLNLSTLHHRHQCHLIQLGIDLSFVTLICLFFSVNCIQNKKKKKVLRVTGSSSSFIHLSRQILAFLVPLSLSPSFSLFPCVYTSLVLGHHQAKEHITKTTDSRFFFFFCFSSRLRGFQAKGKARQVSQCRPRRFQKRTQPDTVYMLASGWQCPVCV